MSAIRDTAAFQSPRFRRCSRSPKQSPGGFRPEYRPEYRLEYHRGLRLVLRLFRSSQAVLSSVETVAELQEVEEVVVKLFFVRDEPVRLLSIPMQSGYGLGRR